MDARKSLAAMSLIAMVPGLGLAIFGALGGISGASGALMLLYWFSALIGLVLTLLPLLIFANIFPKTGPGKPKAAKAAAVEKGGKAAAAVAEPASEELDVAESDEFAEASDEFSAVSDDELEFGEADEFEEEEDDEPVGEDWAIEGLGVDADGNLGIGGDFSNEEPEQGLVWSEAWTAKLDGTGGIVCQSTHQVAEEAGLPPSLNIYTASYGTAGFGLLGVETSAQGNMTQAWTGFFLP